MRRGVVLTRDPDVVDDAERAARLQHAVDRLQEIDGRRFAAGLAGDAVIDVVQILRRDDGVDLAGDAGLVERGMYGLGITEPREQRLLGVGLNEERRVLRVHLALRADGS